MTDSWKKQLTSEEFIAKLEELLESGNDFGTQYDAHLGRVCLVVLIDEKPVRYMSPVIRTMETEEYIPFRAELESLMPKTDHSKGHYW